MYSGIWMYAWDLADESADRVMGWAADAGLQALQIAGSYHAGWFIHPHNPRHRAFMAPDGCVYFHPDITRYRQTVLKPRVAPVCQNIDWMREAGKRLDKFGLKLVSWTVCTHNTRLGLLHPDCTVHNCFGDSYPHALCPANNNVRRYISALCADLAHNYPMHAIQLESPGFLGLQHGHHHERDLTMLTSLEVALMDLCFCNSCMRFAEAKHIDAARVKAEVRELLNAGMAAAPYRPASLPATIAEAETKINQLASYRAMRKEIEDSLIIEIRLAMNPSSAELWLLGPYSKQIENSIDVYCNGVYGLKASEVHTAVEAERRKTPSSRLLYTGVRLGLNSVRDEAELTDIVENIAGAGGDGVMFYNYSESPMKTLEWIKPTLAHINRK